MLTTILAVNLAWLFAGAALTPILRDPRRSRLVNLLFAGLLIISVLVTTLL